jgi:hypothetical protein
MAGVYAKWARAGKIAQNAGWGGFWAIEMGWATRRLKPPRRAGSRDSMGFFKSLSMRSHTAEFVFTKSMMSWMYANARPVTVSAQP